MIDQAPVHLFAKDQRFQGFLRVRSCDQRSSANGSKYLDMLLADKTGEIVSKKWDSGDLVFHVGDIVKVRGVVTEFNGKLQFRADLIRVIEPEDGVELADLMPAAPYPPEDMRDEIYEAARNIQNDDFRNLTLYLLDAAGERILTAPAAHKLHHAMRSGLLYHTLTMLRAAKALLPVYGFLDADLLIAGVILHDLRKIEEMHSDEWGQVSDYTTEGLLLGHIITGIASIGEAGKAVHAAEENILLLQHMVLSHHYEPEFGSPKKPMFPEAELLHYLDIIDARMYEMMYALEPLSGGSFTPKIWSLERRLYKRQGE